MRKHRRKLLVSLVAATTAAGLLAFAGWRAFAPPSHRINRESYERIRRGMTPDEVRRIVGIPPGFYPDSEALHVQRVSEEQLEAGEKPEAVDVWLCDTGAVHVRYGSSGTAVDKYFAELTPAGGTIPWYERLREHFGF